jgi:hypothetical protein
VIRAVRRARILRASVDSVACTSVAVRNRASVQDARLLRRCGGGRAICRATALRKDFGAPAQPGVGANAGRAQQFRERPQ